MNYEDFRKRIYQELNNIVETDVTVERKTVGKKKGVVLDAIVLHNNAEQLTPCIYLNHYYEQYKRGTTVAEIIKEMLTVEIEGKGVAEQQLLITLGITDFSKVSGFICYKLVNAKMNEALLKSVPHKKFLDLAIVYMLLAKEEEDSIDTILIQNEHLQMWNVTINELHEHAMLNTPRLMPTRIKSMEEVLQELSGLSVEKSDSKRISDSSMYILSNSKGIHGASTILYPEVLGNFIHRNNVDVEQLYILPSSIHEGVTR